MIRILLDECLPVKLMYRFEELNKNFQVSTVTGMNWTGVKNGKLLEKAETDFDVFITIDQNLSFQQELSKYSIAVIALKAKSNRYKDLLKFVESTSEIIKKLRAVSFIQFEILSEEHNLDQISVRDLICPLSRREFFPSASSRLCG